MNNKEGAQWQAKEKKVSLEDPSSKGQESRP
jgi:hypothetical protein